MKNLPLFAYIFIILLVLNACSSTSPVIKSPHYTWGEQDGCATANGNYTKNSELFRSDPDYENGWFAGRRECNPAFHRK